MAEQKDNKLMRFGFYLLLALLLVNVYNLVFKQDKPVVDNAELLPISLETVKTSYSIGSAVKLKVTNNSDRNLSLDYICPDAPLTIMKTSVIPPVVVDKVAKLDCKNLNDPLLHSFKLPANSSKILGYDLWTSSLFSELGSYKITGTFTVGGDKFQVNSNEFQIKERGFLSSIWYYVLYQPFYNFLVLLIQIVPGYSLAAGIIILTIIVRLILLIPSQKALRSQKQLQETQPRIQEIQNKYRDNKQKQAKATMELYQKAKINPFSGCLPLLIQLPILLALYQLFWRGFQPDQLAFLYSFIPSPGTIDPYFLGIINLANPHFGLALIAGVCQFFQTKMVTPKTKGAKVSGQMGQFSQMMQKQMLYFFPVFTVLILWKLPAAIGVYWIVTALFSILQQHLIYKPKKAGE